jgi:hypothetical protein
MPQIFTVLVWLVFVCAALGIVWWMLSKIAMAPPIRMVANLVFGVIALMLLFWLFSSIVGPPSLGHFGHTSRLEI